MNNPETLKSVHLFVMLVALSFVSGCASNKAEDWYRPDTDVTGVNRDLADCKKQAEMTAKPLAAVDLGAAIADNIRKENIIKDCMTAKGYEFLAQQQTNKKGTPQIANSQVANHEATENRKAEIDLMGHWESVALKGDKIGNGVTKMEVIFKQDNKVEGKTTSNGSEYVINGKYLVEGSKILMWDNKQSKPSTVDFSLVGDHLIISSPGAEIIYKKNEN